jgi:hypothetical protein
VSALRARDRSEQRPNPHAHTRSVVRSDRKVDQAIQRSGLPVLGGILRGDSSVPTWGKCNIRNGQREAATLQRNANQMRITEIMNSKR